ASMPVHILLTKADKLKRGPAQNTMLQVKKAMKPHGDLVTVQTFSSLSGDGIDVLKKRLNGWLLPAPVAPAEDETGADDAQETDQPE
ncbi:MAG: YihA family ribosome biogenesis GTP-binding protein, partial [Oceanospirillaceae bacterium]|nr:YihA family ribosome biogenesis GTP-binding protein [Oceanospirillaceae bacterium]